MSDSAPERSGTLIPSDTRPNKKRKRNDADVLDQTSHSTVSTSLSIPSRQLEPEMMGDNPPHSEPSGPENIPPQALVESQDLESVPQANADYRQYDQAGWNNLVHTPIIDAATKDVGHGIGHWHLDFMPCERAAVAPSYERELAVRPRVDYMFFMVPYSDDGKGLLNLHSTLDEITNFTNYRPIYKYPINLSIKSKDPHGEDPVSPEHHLAA
ncbi:hypothetical protein FIE12Z_1356 [Fusarium flagelliforme]|uniref:PD-(D/E)XK nuclease-like domain-containing protein n=1 Tax=Fusarium flagelliforme TaxID=2675880 RepID=A0A395N2N7_9HYPO|nr:hypothetical protein FIE12Z_1356 [Fusarium flagelliforme]